ncbi:Remorin family protein [Theobroma cacao]|uniref:Remorin family protein n=1 Tax=Theobroma cacao TaxID=3641 RepID=A0A061G4C7_THECC|nr:Remorin family protein [Theobroma cacao]
MGEEEANKMEASEPKEQQPVKEEKDAAAKTDVAEEKSLIPVPEIKNCSEKEKGVLKIRFGFHISTFESAFTFMESWVQKIIVIAGLHLPKHANLMPDELGHNVPWVACSGKLLVANNIFHFQDTESIMFIEMLIDLTKAAAVATEKSPNNRDSVLARVETEKRLALLKAWEENEKAKVENKAHKKISAIGSWENTKKAGVEAQLKKIEEQLEKKKAEYAEKMKNRVAEIHREAEEKRAMIEAKRGEDFLKIEETAAKFRATGYTPKKFLGCFSS